METQDCPRCKGTGKLHGEYRFDVGARVGVQHRGRWYKGVITERYMHPAHFGGDLSDTYLIEFELTSGERRHEVFGHGINVLTGETE